MKKKNENGMIYEGLKEVTVPIYGTIPFKTEYSPYDRNTAYLSTDIGLHVAVNVTENGEYYAMESAKYDYKGLKSRILTPYEYKGHYFRYNMTDALLRHVYKASDEEVKDNDEWKVKYGKPLHHIDEYGFICIQSVGLSREHWFNKEARDEYLSEYLAAYSEESEYLVAMAAYEFRDLI